MIINGIDYYVGLYIMGADGFPEYETHFEDFHALNTFIRKNADNPRYTQNQMCYSFLENIDGEPGAFSWVSNISWCEFSDERIQTEIDNFIEDEIENTEHWAKVDQFSKEIHYFDEGVDYTKKRHHFKDIAYVCPRCIRHVEDCRCAGYPYYLVQIDKLMVPIIRELNSKGYKTIGCCAGHPDDDEFKGSGIYIAFAENYAFDEPFPAGGKYSNAKHAISYIPTEDDYDDLIGFQTNVLYRLEDWAEMLFEIDFSMDVDEDDEN